MLFFVVVCCLVICPFSSLCAAECRRSVVTAHKQTLRVSVFTFALPDLLAVFCLPSSHAGLTCMSYWFLLCAVPRNLTSPETCSCGVLTDSSTRAFVPAGHSSPSGSLTQGNLLRNTRAIVDPLQFWGRGLGNPPLVS